MEANDAYCEGSRRTCSTRTLRPGKSLLHVCGPLLPLLGGEGFIHLTSPNLSAYSRMPSSFQLFSNMSSPMAKRMKLFMISYVHFAQLSLQQLQFLHRSLPVACKLHLTYEDSFLVPTYWGTSGVSNDIRYHAMIQRLRKHQVNSAHHRSSLLHALPPSERLY